MGKDNRAAKKGRQMQEIAAVPKYLVALKLRGRGLSYAEIAKRVGYADGSGAYKAVKKAMKKVFTEPAEEARAFELARLDEMMAGIWDKAITGDDKAIAAVLKIMDRRARLLGLDSPERFETDLFIEYLNDWRAKK